MIFNDLYSYSLARFDVDSLVYLSKLPSPDLFQNSVFTIIYCPLIFLLIFLLEMVDSRSLDLRSLIRRKTIILTVRCHLSCY